MLHDIPRPHVARTDQVTLAIHEVFHPLKKTLQGRRFGSDEVKDAVVQWFQQQLIKFFAERIQCLVRQQGACLNAMVTIFNVLYSFAHKNPRTGFI
jgi:hypothetical protein